MIQIFIAGVLWGTIGIFVKGLNSLGADAALTSFLRMFSAFVVMLSAGVFMHGRKVVIRDIKALIFCALLGLVSNGMFNVFYTTSIRLNGMGIASVLLYTAPVFTAAASWLIFHERFTPLKIFALIVNIAGCVLTVTGGQFSGNGSISLAGILAGLGSGFGYGMAAVFGRLAGERTDEVSMSVWSYFFALLFLLVFMRPDVSVAVHNPKILGLGFLYGLIPTALAYLVYYIGLKKVEDTGRVPVIASIEPVTAVLIGMLIYNEEMGTANFIGVAVVLLSIIIMVKAK